MIKSHNLSRKANETPHHVVRLIGHQPRISVRRGGSRTAASSKMEHFVIIVNGWKPLTIITKRSILDIAAVLDPPQCLREVLSHLVTYICLVIRHP